MTQKIAILCDYRLLPDRVGGMDHFFWRFDAECKANGMQVDWFFPNTATYGEYNKLTIFSAESETIETAFLSHFQHEKPRYSHVFTHFLELCTPFFKKVKQQTQAKIIAVDHNPRPLGGYPFKKRLKKRLKGMFYSRFIDVFVGVSEYTRQELIRDFGTQIRTKSQVIYNGILTENIPQRTKTNQPPRFLVVSHLRKSKGIQDLIKAVELLPKTIKNALNIDVYGEGPYEKHLKNQIENKNLTENFNFKGSLSRVSSVFCQYDYLVHPSYMECFSLTILESLAANVPVITTPVGGNLEVVNHGENGFIIPVQNPEKLAFLLQEIWEGKRKISGNMRAEIEQSFTIAQMLQNHLNLIN